VDSGPDSDAFGRVKIFKALNFLSATFFSNAAFFIALIGPFTAMACQLNYAAGDISAI
jgi:hypothetical protein